MASISHPPGAPLWCIGHIGPLQQSAVFAAKPAAGAAAKVASNANTASSEVSLCVMEEGLRHSCARLRRSQLGAREQAGARKKWHLIAVRTKPGRLDTGMRSRYINNMAQSYLVFDFGSNEEAAERARRTIDRWKQAFRLDKKVMMKFERQKPEDDIEPAVERSGDGTASEAEPETRKAGRNAAEKSASETAGKVAGKDRKKASGEATEEPPEQPAEQTGERITLIVRLEFSDHEKLSHRRWLARIPAEEPFKDAQPKTVEHGDPEFAAVMERFQGGAGRAHGFTGSIGTS